MLGRCVNTAHSPLLCSALNRSTLSVCNWCMVLPAFSINYFQVQSHVACELCYLSFCLQLTCLSMHDLPTV